MQDHNQRNSNSVQSDIHIRPILKFGVALVIVAAVMHVVIWFLFNYFTIEQTKQDPGLTPLAPHHQVVPPEPRLQITPVQDLATVRKEEEVLLSSYGWVDKQNGVVRIPVSEAMKLMVRKSNTK